MPHNIRALGDELALNLLFRFSQLRINLLFRRRKAECEQNNTLRPQIQIS